MGLGLLAALILNHRYARWSGFLVLLLVPWAIAPVAILVVAALLPAARASFPPDQFPVSAADHIEKLSGMSHLSGILVDVRRVPS